MPRADFPIPVREVVQVIATATAEAILDHLRSQQAAVWISAGSPLLSVKEACGYLKLSRSELNRLEHAGVLVPMRFGKRVFYARAALDEFIKDKGGP